jgi:hypothetical protein
MANGTGQIGKRASRITRLAIITVLCSARKKATSEVLLYDGLNGMRVQGAAIAKGNLLPSPSNF